MSTKLALDQEVDDCIKTYSNYFSRFQSDSILAEMAKTPGTYLFPEYASELFELYDHLYTITHHAVTPLIGSLLNDTGYDAAYSFVEQNKRQVLEWGRDVAWNGGHTLTSVVPVELDFGAAGKGQLVDMVTNILRARSLAEITVDAGGDMRTTIDAPSLKIGLEHPDNPDQVVGVAELSGRAICGSADNRRVWGKYHHVLDPRTQDSTRQIRATWVVASSAMVADGLATALFFVSPDILHPFDFEYVMIRSDMSMQSSSGFVGTIFS